MLIDNVVEKVSDTLISSIQDDDKLSVMTGLFSIYAYEYLKELLDKVDSARLLFSQAKGFDYLSSSDNESPFGALNGTALENKFRNQLKQKAVAQEFASWLEKKVSVRLVQQVGAVHQHVIHVDSIFESVAINGAQFNELC